MNLKDWDAVSLLVHVEMYVLTLGGLYAVMVHWFRVDEGLRLLSTKNVKGVRVNHAIAILGFVNQFTSGILYFFWSPRMVLFSVKIREKFIPINNFVCQ